MLASASVFAAEIPDRERLEKGETVITTEEVPGSTFPRVTVRALVKAPGEKIWKIINDCGRYKETMVRIRESKELSRSGTTVRCQVTLASPAFIRDLSSITVAQHTVSDGRWVRSWSLESSEDYKTNTGSWTLIRDETNPQRTFVQYQVLSEPKIWVPDSIQQYAMKKGLPGLIDKLRSQVE
jgi:hypothetical protein